MFHPEPGHFPPEGNVSVGARAFWVSVHAPLRAEGKEGKGGRKKTRLSVILAIASQKYRIASILVTL